MPGTITRLADDRRLPVTSISAILLAFMASLLLHDASAQTFRANLAHTGEYEGAGVKGPPTVKWTFHTGGQVLSSAAVEGGVVYVGSTDGKLYALDAATGTMKWKFATLARIASSPAVADGLVFFTSYDSKVHAVDAATGKSRWEFQTGGERRFTAKGLHGSLPAGESMPDPFDMFLSSPAVSGGSVVVGSGDGNVYAFDAKSGAVRWKFQTGDVVHASPAIADGVVFIGSWDSYFYALDATTGAEKWRFKTGEDSVNHNQVGIQSSAAVANGVVYFGCRDSNLYALDAATGTEKWKFNNKGSWVVGSPAVHEGRVYFGTSETGMLYSLVAVSGAVVFGLDFKHWPTFSSAAVAGNLLYVGSNEGRLRAVDLGAGRVTWTFRTAASRAEGPRLTHRDGTPNYAGAYRENFYQAMVTGAERMLSVGAIVASPVVAGNIIYVGSTDGNLYALR